MIFLSFLFLFLKYILKKKLIENVYEYNQRFKEIGKRLENIFFSRFVIWNIWIVDGLNCSSYYENE